MEPLTDVCAVSPNTATFSCAVKLGEPKADIAWSKHGDALTAGDKYKMSFDDDVAKLEIVDCDVSDSGEYKIVATNKVAEVSSTANLLIHSKLMSSFWLVTTRAFDII